MTSFNHALSPNVINLSEKGLRLLCERLETLEARYADVCEQRRVAHELSGDGWHDNPEFNRLQQMESYLNNDIQRVSAELEKACVFNVTEGSRRTDRVWLGSVVELEIVDEENGDSRTEIWEIAGHGESDARRRCLAYNAPLAQHVLTLQKEDWSDEFELGGKTVSVNALQLFASRRLAGLKS